MIMTCADKFKSKKPIFNFRIDSELRKWIEPRNLKLLNDNLSMVYVEPTIISTNIEQSKNNEYAGKKDNKIDKMQKRNFR